MLGKLKKISGIVSQSQIVDNLSGPSEKIKFSDGLIFGCYNSL